MTGELVSVVVPAYNAAKTVNETLLSARAQTYKSLEIIVVDDGSTDATLSIVQQHASQDPRVRILSQQHRGHSAARNRGIAAATGNLIATLDADDLWRPSKIAKQVEALRAGGERVGLVYTWFASLDEKGRIRSVRHSSAVSGDALRDCCCRNPIGNGSSALMRKAAILECGGFDESLSGCEDLKLYIAIAERYHYAVVTEHLTGYRQSNHNVTSDVECMRRSADVVLAQLEQRLPQFRPELAEMRRSLYEWLFFRAVMAGRANNAVALMRALWAIDRRLAVRVSLAVPKRILMSSWYLTGRRLLRGILRQPGDFSVPRFLSE